MTNRPPRICPASLTVDAASCPDAPACAADPGTLMPRQGPERAVMLVLRYIAAAAETGDAACWDAALDGAESTFGPRDGALLVARAAALLRAVRREGTALRFLPPPCRRLSADEADLLEVLRARLQGCGSLPEVERSSGFHAALSDLVAPLALSHAVPRPGLVRSVASLSLHTLV